LSQQRLISFTIYTFYPDRTMANSSNYKVTFGTDDNDNIYSPHGSNIIQGLAGNDLLVVSGNGNNLINGDYGANSGWVLNAEGKYVYTGTVDTTGNGFGSSTTTAGSNPSSPANPAPTSEYDDRIIGGEGDDVLLGQLGKDSIEGGAGDDRINGGEGDDYWLDGGAGNDKLYGSNGNNQLFGGTGNDELYGVNGQNLLDGGEGNDLLYGGLGVDDLFGNLGNDFIYANAGNDNLSGGDGDDQLFGQEGNDILLGGNGNDILVGVSTTTDLGRGTIDILTGGGGGDRFILGAVGKIYYDDAITATAGMNDYGLITDFVSTEDIIQLSGQATDYILGASVSGINGVGIYRQGLTTNELVGIIQDAGNISLTDTFFSYV
jgi:Ca2+-binding RTX toxin-like protein